MKARVGEELYLYSFLKFGARCGWLVNAKPRPLYRREREELPVIQGVGWSSGPVCTYAENVARHRDSIPGPTSLIARRYTNYVLRIPSFCLLVYSVSFI